VTLEPTASATADSATPAGDPVARVAAPGAAPPAAPSARPRLAWVDATRGYCVAAVVLFHVLLWYYATDSMAAHPTARGAWSAVNSVLGSVRMPVLLAVSGLVLARQVREGLHRSTTGFRAANNYYLYVVWLLVYAAFYAVVSYPALPHRVDGWEVVRQLVLPETTLWYVYALALYIPLLALARRVPPAVVIVLLTALSVGMHGWYDGEALWHKVPELFVFFAVGVYGAGPVRRLAERASWWRLGVALVAAAFATGLGRFATTPVTNGLLFVLRGVAFMALAVVAIAIAVRWTPVRRLGVALGRRTLVVYVMHPLLIALLIVVTVATGDAVHGLVQMPLVAAVLPVVLTAAVVLTSIGVQAGAERLRLAFLFEMPARWRHRFGRA